MKAIEDGLKKLGNASADLSYAVKAAAGGPWEGWTGLLEEERIRQLEEQQDVVDNRLAKLKGRQQEMVRMENFPTESKARRKNPTTTASILRKTTGRGRARQRWMTKLRQGGEN